MMRRPSLRQDTRGAIVLFGLAASIILVGAIWYVAGVGTSLVMREELQNGADTAAFTSAVYHARAMNMVAVTNLLLASFTTILSSIEVLWTTVAPIQISCSIPFGQAVQTCAQVTPTYNRLVQLRNNEYPTIHAQENGLYAAAHGITLGVPWMGEERSSQTSLAAGGHIALGFSISPAMLGGQRASRVSYEDNKGQGQGVPGLSREARHGYPNQYGLPVQNEALPAYCDRQGLQLMAKNLPQLVVPVLEQTPLPRSTWEDTNRTNMAQAYQIMCNTRRGANLDNVGGSQFGKLYSHRDQMTAAGGQSEAPGAKRVLAGARNGNDHFSVWGFAGGVPEKHVHPSQVMQVAGMGKFRISDFTRISNVGFAEAEYYFQPSQPRARWEQVESLALWSPRWQARLRRVRSPSIPEVAGRLQDATGNVSAFLNTSPPGSNDIASQPQALDSGLGIARGLFGAGARNLDDYVRTEAKSRNTMLGNKFTVIH